MKIKILELDIQPQITHKVIPNWRKYTPLSTKSGVTTGKRYIEQLISKRLNIFENRATGESPYFLVFKGEFGSKYTNDEYGYFKPRKEKNLNKEKSKNRELDINLGDLTFVKNKTCLKQDPIFKSPFEAKGKTEIWIEYLEKGKRKKTSLRNVSNFVSEGG